MWIVVLFLRKDSCCFALNESDQNCSNSVYFRWLCATGHKISTKWHQRTDSHETKCAYNDVDYTPGALANAMKTYAYWIIAQNKMFTFFSVNTCMFCPCHCTTIQSRWIHSTWTVTTMFYNETNFSYACWIHNTHTAATSWIGRWTGTNKGARSNYHNTATKTNMLNACFVASCTFRRLFTIRIFCRWDSLGGDRRYRIHIKTLYHFPCMLECYVTHTRPHYAIVAQNRWMCAPLFRVSVFLGVYIFLFASWCLPFHPIALIESSIYPVLVVDVNFASIRHSHWLTVGTCCFHQHSLKEICTHFN